jgi:hypothetical protein
VDRLALEVAHVARNNELPDIICYLEGSLNGRWFTLLLVAAAIALGAVVGRTLSTTATDLTAYAEVTANIDRGPIFRLYFNNSWSEPQEASIQRGQ